MILRTTIISTFVLLFCLPANAQQGNNICESWLVGTWKFCRDTTFRKTMKCRTPLHFYTLKADGTYTQSNTFGNGKYPFKGFWEVQNNTLILRDSTVYEGVFSSSGVEVYPIQFVNSDFFYSKTDSDESERSPDIYHYFIRKAD